MAMELHLGLALSNIPGSLHHRDGFSSYSGDHRLDASIEGHGSSISIDDNQRFCFSNKKRRLEEAPEADTASSDSLRRTLPLFFWNDHPNVEDDRRDRPSSCSIAAVENGDETDGVVGWPPINSYRKRHCDQGQDTGGESKCKYVKVQMEGVVIARKIDLNLHRSYQTLISTILFMFGRGNRSKDMYNLAYLDKKGDWLLVDDLPWRRFVGSVQRLRLLRREHSSSSL